MATTANTDFTPFFTTWFKNQTELLYNVHPTEQLSSSLPTIFTEDAQIDVNGVPIAIEEFKNNINDRTRFVRQNFISWDAISTEAKNGGNDEAIVVGTFVHTRSLNFRIRVGPAQLKTVISFRAKIKRLPCGNDQDALQISELHQAEHHEAVPVQIPERRSATLNQNK